MPSAAPSAAPTSSLLLLLPRHLSVLYAALWALLLLAARGGATPWAAAHFPSLARLLAPYAPTRTPAPTSASALASRSHAHARWEPSDAALRAALLLDIAISALNATAMLEYAARFSQECPASRGRMAHCILRAYWPATHAAFIAKWVGASYPPALVFAPEVARAALFMTGAILLVGAHDGAAAATSPLFLAELALRAAGGFALTMLTVTLSLSPLVDAPAALPPGLLDAACPAALRPARDAACALAAAAAHVARDMAPGLPRRGAHQVTGMAALSALLCILHSAAPTLATIGRLQMLLFWATLALSALSGDEAAAGGDAALAALQQARGASQRSSHNADGYAAAAAEAAAAAAACAQPELTWQDVSLGEPLGHGSFATVYAAQWRGTRVALKCWTDRGGARGNRGGDEHPAAAAAAAVAAALGGQAFGGYAGGSTDGGAGGDAVAAAAAEEDARCAANEASLLMALRHPNVLQVYGILPPPARALVMERGVCTLGQLLRGGEALPPGAATASLPALTWQRRVELALAVAAGVEFLHAHAPPICHGDITCSNVLIVEGGAPKLSDFGLAFVGHAHARRRVQIGNVDYAAPECVRRQPVTHPRAVDAYAFGVLLHRVTHPAALAAGFSFGFGGSAASGAAFGGSALSGGAFGGSVGGGSSAGGSVGDPNANVVKRYLSALQGVFTAERAGYQPAVSAACPPPLATLIRACCALAPETRPSFRAARRALEQALPRTREWVELPLPPPPLPLPAAPLA
jgi:serine/threonine protein kinase